MIRDERCRATVPRRVHYGHETPEHRCNWKARSFNWLGYGLCGVHDPARLFDRARRRGRPREQVELFT